MPKPTIIPTVRGVDLYQLSENDFVWRYSDLGKEEHSPHFTTPDAAAKWLFMPVFVNAPPDPDPDPELIEDGFDS